MLYTSINIYHIDKTAGHIWLFQQECNIFCNNAKLWRCSTHKTKISWQNICTCMIDLSLCKVCFWCLHQNRKKTVLYIWNNFYALCNRCKINKNEKIVGLSVYRLFQYIRHRIIHITTLHFSQILRPKMLL